VSSDLNVSEDPRAGLELTRYHSWPVHRRQSVGEHSAQIMRILLTVWPDCPRRMLVHAVTHDIGEMAGDVQYPFKQRIFGMKAAHDMAERVVRDDMRRVFGLPKDQVLTEFEESVFKIVEFIEMWEYGLREMNMGNRYGRVIAARCILAASKRLEELDPVAASRSPELRPAIMSYVNTRTKWEGV